MTKAMGRGGRAVCAGSLIAHFACVVSVALLACARAGAMDETARVKTAASNIDTLESVMDRYYRGEPLDAALERVNTMVKEHNDLVDSRNRELDASGAKVDEARKPVEKVRAEIDRMDAALKHKPSTSDRAAVKRYNALLKRRNAAVKRYNKLNDATNDVVNAHNAKVKKVKVEFKLASSLVEAVRTDYDERREALERFEKGGDDIAFFESVNRTLAAVYAEMRTSRSSAGWRRVAARLRGIRRELGERATAEHARRDHGLVIIEASLAGEPCWFIVDTGAMRTTIGPGMVAALGLSGKLGDEIELVLAGGLKTKGRELTLPRVEVSGADERDVPAAAVKVSDVGVDGLLGQSFLKRFVYTIDESTRAKLILKRRQRR